jgi:hypothetical protein
MYLNIVMLSKNLYMTRLIAMDPWDKHKNLTVYKRLMMVVNDWNM